MDNKKLKYIFSAGLILTAAIWGFAFVIVKDTLDYIGPTWMVGIRFSIAAIFLSLIFVKRFRNLTGYISFPSGVFFCIKKYICTL